MIEIVRRVTTRVFGRGARESTAQRETCDPTRGFTLESSGSSLYNVLFI